MGVIDKKRKIFGNIAAARTLTESMPNLKLSSSFPSINNDGNTITFLTDLIKSLIGYNALVKGVVDILTISIDQLEIEIKKAIKLQLKSIVSCGINPSLPAFIKSTGEGIVIEVKKIDFLDLMKVDPQSSSGKLLYNDSSSGLESTDFNTFLYSVIQDDGNTHTWKNILNFTFVSLDPNGVNPNNSLIIKANQIYDNKTLNDLNNNFIDSLTLFNSENLVNKIIDTVFGSISIKIGRTRKQLENEGKINSVIDKMVNSDEFETITETYFTFNNEQLAKIQRDADARKKGVKEVDAATSFESSIDEESLTLFNTEMGVAVTLQQRKDILAKNIDKMADETTENSPNPNDKQTIKLNFIQNIIDTLIKTIVGVVLSPKVVLIFLVNFKIIYGATGSYTDGVNFIEKNKVLFKSLIKTVSTLITEFLLIIAMKRISELVSETQIKKQVDKAKNKTSQLLSLVGVSQEAIRVIKGLS